MTTKHSHYIWSTYTQMEMSDNPSPTPKLIEWLVLVQYIKQFVVIYLCQNVNISTHEIGTVDQTLLDASDQHWHIHITRIKVPISFWECAYKNVSAHIWLFHIDFFVLTTIMTNIGSDHVIVIWHFLVQNASHIYTVFLVVNPNMNTFDYWETINKKKKEKGKQNKHVFYHSWRSLFDLKKSHTLH